MPMSDYSTNHPPTAAHHMKLQIPDPIAALIYAGVTLASFGLVFLK